MSPDEVVQLLLKRSQRLYLSGKNVADALLKDADERLALRLWKLAGNSGGRTFTQLNAIAFRKQIGIVQLYVDKRLLGLTHAQSVKAMRMALRDTVKSVQALEKAFTGSAKTLRIGEASAQSDLLRARKASLLRSNEASVRRYSEAMITQFEANLRLGYLTEMSQHEVISRLVSAAGKAGITAATLRKGEPRWFPSPTGYVQKRYWAERIVRTETSYAHNTTNMAAIGDMRNQFPDMKKKILAHFDMRTAWDSVAVHGQVRSHDKYFRDGAGREYLHPPARPNDRETVIPWRVAWPETEHSAPKPPEEIAQAFQRATPKKAQAHGPARRQQMAQARAIARGLAKAERRGQT